MISKIFRGVDVMKDYSYISFALSILMATISVLFPSTAALVVASILMFASMDAIGYFHLLWGGDQGKEVPNYQERLVSYRFIQTGFQILLSILLFSVGGILPVLAFNIVWWFGFCDLMYYVLLKQNFMEYGDMYWLWWTPIGIARSMGLVSAITGTMLIIQSLVGIIVAFKYFVF